MRADYSEAERGDRVIVLRFIGRIPKANKIAMARLVRDAATVTPIRHRLCVYVAPQEPSLAQRSKRWAARSTPILAAMRFTSPPSPSLRMSGYSPVSTSVWRISFKRVESVVKVRSKEVQRGR